MFPLKRQPTVLHCMYISPPPIGETYKSLIQGINSFYLCSTMQCIHTLLLYFVILCCHVLFFPGMVFFKRAFPGIFSGRAYFCISLCPSPVCIPTLTFPKLNSPAMSYIKHLNLAFLGWGGSYCKNTSYSNLTFVILLTIQDKTSKYQNMQSCYI